jgi:two-component system chemotaxis response regulator CheB
MVDFAGANMPNHDLVVIGGSAGSIEPLKIILSMLPSDLAAAILIVVHVPSNSTGIFTTVAAAACDMPVKNAADGDEIVNGTVYLAPPNYHLLIAGDHLRLGTGPRENLVRPAIDPLMRSAALSDGARAIGVILSGMLNDGASGLATIKMAGGIALV